MKIYQMESNIYEKHADPSFLRDLRSIYKWNSTRLVKALVVFLLVSLLSFTVFTIFIGLPADGFLSKIIDYEQSKEDNTRDKLLGGLLLDGLDERSCLSRYQSNLYRRSKTRQPSPNLISRLRKYEALHKKCGPNTNSYNKTLEILKSGGEKNNDSGCKYVIWTPFEGLGNRMLSLASTFLYALLTNRVLLIGDAQDLSDLFCEPFQDVSWFLPPDFPIGPFNTLDPLSPQSYKTLVRNNFNRNSRVPPFVYMHMVFDHVRTPRLSLCDQNQKFLQNVPWLIFKSNVYFAPSLFSVPSFEQQLNNLFPEKDTVFHHLGRYLFHPTNSVWGLITRYHDAYLAKADEILGIQIRIFESSGHGPLKHVLDQILSCTITQNLLPKINKTEHIIKKSENKNTKAVLTTSLAPGYYEEIRSMYWQYPTVTRETVALYQPSHEELQQTGNKMHDRKALAEVYLLSFADKIVTSAQSTFGYVAQSLGGLKPWILHMPDSRRMPNPPCHHSSSMEPCFMFAPDVYSCKNEKGIETATLLPHLRGCEDIHPGLKLFEK